jgi:hypothetical protein
MQYDGRFCLLWRGKLKNGLDRSPNYASDARWWNLNNCGAYGIPTADDASTTSSLYSPPASFSTMNMEYDIVATVRFYPVEAGGRKGATPPDKLGCLFEFEGEKYDCRLLFNEVGALSPGGTGRVPIVFLHPELVKQRLQVGSRFTLWELRTIGEGIVEQVGVDS